MANEVSTMMDRLGGLVGEQWRKTTLMPRLCSRNFENILTPAYKGETVRMNAVENPGEPSDATPGPYPTNISDVKDVNRSITLEFWKEHTFILSIKDQQDIYQGVPPRSLQVHINSMAEAWDRYLYQKLFLQASASVGTPGTPLFDTDVRAMGTVGAIMTTAKAPRGPQNRHMILTPLTYSDLATNANFLQADQGGPVTSIVSGEVGGQAGIAVGFSVFENNNFISFAPPAGSFAVDAAAITGAITIVVDDGAGALPAEEPQAGDIFAIAGNAQQYVVQSYTPGTTEGQVEIYPPLVADVSDGDAITFVAAHDGNVAFHSRCLQCVSRPHALPQTQDPVTYRNIVDGGDMGSGAVITLSQTPGHLQTSWSVTMLGGAAVEPLTEGAIVRLLE